MRRVTRNVILALLLVVAGLLALGALPSTLQSGDPYYLTAEEATESHAAVNVSNLSEQRFPYTTSAVRDGRSEPYYKGPFGLKEAFSHSPFDELAALRDRNPDAVDGEAVYVRDGGRCTG
ncbi:hypothetical protein VB779_17365 [Haloarculaceae archaeon H-GB11]|nr:hypothetical protein [Haloarculaceae archaeon H-GB11]